MSDEVYQAIAQAKSGFVESPAGCGKTEAIVRTVANYCSGTQLVLTHTHAGVDALRQRFREQGVSRDKYHVDTIAGWSWNWVRRYPANAKYEGSCTIAVWDEVYSSMIGLLSEGFVISGILNSYTGVIVDEYQDCTIAMHALIVRLNEILPCRILGDDLQGIFDFNSDPLIGWAEVKRAFGNDLGSLETPYRWVKAGNPELGRWLLNCRPDFRRSQEPDYRGSPIERRMVSFPRLGPQLIRLTREKEGSVCIIRPKARNLNAGLETTLVKMGFRVLESNELSDLQKLIVAFEGGTADAQQKAAMKFLYRAYGGLKADDKRFVQRIVAGQQQNPRRADRQRLCQVHANGITQDLMLDLLDYCDQLTTVSCKIRESVSALRCILEKRSNSDIDVRSLYADEVVQRKFRRRGSVTRSIGSTLLVKGLEFDHVVILRNQDWLTSWGGYCDLYVALTRGSKSATLIEIAA